MKESFWGNLEATSLPSVSGPAAEHCSCSASETRESRHPSVIVTSEPMTWQWLTADVMKTPRWMNGAELCWSTGTLPWLGWQTQTSSEPQGVWSEITGWDWGSECRETRNKRNKLVGMQTLRSCAAACEPGLEWRKCKWRDREGELIMERGHKQERWVAFSSGRCCGNCPKFRPRQTQVG